MSLLQRPLAGCAVNMSISESEDSAEHGFPAWQVNRVTLQVVGALFGQGVSVVFGHDWREDGVMEAVHSFARQVQPPVPLGAEEAEATTQPLLRNLLPWPDRPRLSSEDLARLASTLRVEAAGLPTELEPYAEAARNEGVCSPLFRYLRARGLTHLRYRLNATSQVRLCLGGRTSGSDGRYPGIIEEALLSLQEKRPLYLAGLFGGAARQLIDAVTARAMPPTFCPATDVEDLYLTPPVAEQDQRTHRDRQVDRLAVWTAFREVGATSLSKRNGLSVEENEELFFTPVVDRIVQLLLIGLSRLRAAGHL